MNTFLHAGMDPLIENNRVVAFAKRGEERVIGHKAATHEERLRDSEMRRCEFFQTRVCRMMTTQQPRAARADHAIFFKSRNRRFAQCGVARESLIIVRGEVRTEGKRKRAHSMRLFQAFHVRGDSRDSAHREPESERGPNSTL